MSLRLPLYHLLTNLVDSPQHDRDVLLNFCLELLYLLLRLIDRCLEDLKLFFVDVEHFGPQLLALNTINLLVLSHRQLAKPCLLLI